MVPAALQHAVHIIAVNVVRSPYVDCLLVVSMRRPAAALAVPASDEPLALAVRPGLALKSGLAPAPTCCVATLCDGNWA
jgi:hypothetical protein